MKEFDIIILGGGSAGYAAARTAIESGKKVAVIEGGDKVGGLCILRGCMPTKALLESAHRHHDIKRAKEFGLSASDVKSNWKRIVARKDELIEDFASYRREQLSSGKFDFIRGLASFEDSHKLLVHPTGDDKKPFYVKGKAIIIATGSVINVHEVPGLLETGFITSDEAINVKKPMKSLVALGGGPIALELAQYFADLGVKVTVIQRSPQLLKNEDTDVAKVLEDAMRREKVNVITDTKLLFVSGKKGAKTVHFEHNGKTRSVKAEEIFYALGRRPNTDSLNLPNAKVRLKGNYIGTTATQQTNLAHVFAVGDVAGPHEIVHIAIQQGEIAARNAVKVIEAKSGEKPKLERIDYRLKSSVTFTRPEIASCGLSEKEAKAKGIDFVSAKYPFNDHGKSMIMGALDGFVKIIAEKKKGEIIGAQIVGPSASDMIHEFVVAMRFRCTVRQFKDIPHYHPTLAEILTYPAEELSELLEEAEGK